jgi:hypothetical protein
MMREYCGQKEDIKRKWRKLHNEELHNFYRLPNIIKSRDNVVGIATDYGMDDRGFGFRVHVVQTASGSTQAPMKWLPGAVSLGINWSGREADHSPTASAEVKITWIYVYTSTPPYAFMA